MLVRRVDFINFKHNLQKSIAGVVGCGNMFAKRIHAEQRKEASFRICKNV